MHQGTRNEGVFYIEDDEFVQGFDNFSAAYYIPNHKISWYLKTNAPDNKQTMTFNILNTSS